MHLWRLWIALGLFAAFAAGAAVVYKWTDGDGVVHFSDQPVPGAEKIVTSSGSTNGIGGTSSSGAGTTPKSATAAPKVGEATIESPSKEQVFFGDDVIPVRLNLAPELQPTQAIAWKLNGATLDQPRDAISFALQTLPRGTYSISATVTDSASGGSLSTESVTFYVRQPSELAPQHKKS
jgi:hypothetical protein